MRFIPRKPTRLPEFDYSRAGYYFVTICTKDMRKILSRVVGFDAHIEPQIRLTHYGKVVEKYILTIPGIDKYVIMPNHIHCIVRIEGPMWASAPTTQSLSQIVRSFKILVTKELGISIFQRSFHDHVIRNEADYQRIWQYIHENPLRWELDRYFQP